MNNFVFRNPTKLLFGKGMIATLSQEIPSDAHVLAVYGGGSIKANGVYEQVMEALQGHRVSEFGEMPPNPTFEKCMEALSVVRSLKAEFLLAIGGGSVIDAVKFIALSFYCQGSESAWEMMRDNARTPKEALSLGAVCTLPASGSEVNSGFVISRLAIQEKRTCGSFLVYPRFSILDPSTTFSLPPRQLRNALVDIFVHVLEQYATIRGATPLQDRQAEAILGTVVEITDDVMTLRDHYDSRASMMWCAVQAMNGLLSRGVVMDWSTHEIGHRITALYGLDHGETLAITLRGVWEHEFDHKQEKLAQYGSRIWGLCGTDSEIARKAIDETETYFRKLGMGTRFSDYGLDGSEVARAVSETFRDGEARMMGENKDIGADAVYSILMSRV